MAFDPELTFTLSRNDKGGNPKRPDYRGEAIVGGVTYKLAGWIREKRSDGTKFISGKLEVKVKPGQSEPNQGNSQPDTSDDRPFSPPPAQSKPASDPNLDEDVPF